MLKVGLVSRGWDVLPKKGLYFHRRRYPKTALTLTTVVQVWHYKVLSKLSVNNSSKLPLSRSDLPRPSMFPFYIRHFQHLRLIPNFRVPIPNSMWVKCGQRE